MNRETELKFSEIPEIEKPRSKFKKPHKHKTTFNAADIIPIYLDQDIMPGDTVKMNMSQIVRMATPLFPTMDNAYIDIMFFFVPNRLLWDHWKAFWGENTNAWYQSVEYEVPQIITTETWGTFAKGTIADYFGLPIETYGLSVSALPFRAYVKIWNDWFRDENLQQEAPNSTSDNDYEVATETFRGGLLLKANKFHDYFTSALPAPQKGNEVLLPLGQWAPVYPRDIDIDTRKGYTTQAMKWGANVDNINMWSSTEKYYNIYGEALKTKETEDTNDSNRLKASADNLNSPFTPEDENPVGIHPTNLWTDLSIATSASINELRTAFAIQRFYEAQARGGSRYIEFIKNIFGVTSPDARLQRSEYLGGKRIPINITQVLQTSSTDATSPQGNTGAYSHTADVNEYFTKSFTEHGILLGLACVRYDHSYNQGIERGWSRKKWTDFYIPQFAHLSEQAIKNKEIYAQGTDEDEEIFGYQEAWADYRYKPNLVTGAMRTTITGTLDAWHYADNYESLPILGSTWIQETAENIDRTIAVSTEISNQFIADFYFDATYVRQMPLYSVPGLLDHM